MVFPKITAHTGCEGTEENTIESALVGIKAGADFVEVDVRTTVDGVSVLSHHDDFSSGSTAHYRISALRCDQLKDLNPSVIRLDTFLAELSRENIRINLDMKDERSLSAALNSVRVHNASDRVVITGCNRKWARRMTSLAPSIPVFLNTPVSFLAHVPLIGTGVIGTLCAAAVDIGCCGLNLHKRYFSEELARIAHQRGLLVSVWTIPENEGFDQYVLRGADNITTKDIRALAEYRASVLGTDHRKPRPQVKS